MVMPLFFEDNHVGDKPSFSVLADANLVMTLQTLVMTHYSKLFPRPPEVKVIGGANINSGNFLVDGFYLKTLALGPQNDYVEMFPEIAESLRANDIPSANFLLNDANRPICFYTTPEGKKACLYLQEFIDAPFYAGTRAELEACIEMIKKLPMAVSHFKPTPGQARYYRDWKPHEVIQTLEPLVKATEANPSEFDKIVLQFFPAAKTVIQTLFTENLTLDKLNHIDLHPHNLLMKENRVAAVLDLESFWAVPENVSVGFALFKLGRKGVSKKYLKVEDVARLLRKNFETNRLLPFAQLEIARRFLTVAKLHYVDNDVKWDADIFKQANAFAEANLLLV